MKSIVVAYDKMRGIGASNDMLWLRDLPTDQQRFKAITMGSTLIMGRKTYESIGFPLPGRRTIVVSRHSIDIDGVTVVSSLGSAYDATQTEDVFVVGGGEIYALALNDVDRIYVTEVDETFPNAEVFFPAIDASLWHESSREKHSKDEKNKYDYSFVVFDRNK